jgi:AraC-like DNA-binding protein
MIAAAEQAEFFAALADPAAFRVMFDHLPDVFFFIKDLDSRLIGANAAVLERLAVRSEAEIVGTQDADYFPVAVALSFREDDERVFASGQPLTHRLEAWYDEQRNLDWFETTKVPLRDRVGAVVGLMGITRRADGRTAPAAVPLVADAMAFIRQNVGQNSTPAEIARACHVSERTLYRKVQQSLGVTPHELVLRLRIQSAAEALIKTGDSILTIALAHGFCDQSTFTHHFHKRTGQTPKQYRVRHQ